VSGWWEDSSHAARSVAIHGGAEGLLRELGFLLPSSLWAWS
jgi:hypothetical protein